MHGSQNSAHVSYHACHAKKTPLALPPGVALYTKYISTFVFSSDAHQQLVLILNCLEPSFTSTAYSTCDTVAAALMTH